VFIRLLVGCTSTVRQYSINRTRVRIYGETGYRFSEKVHSIQESEAGFTVSLNPGSIIEYPLSGKCSLSADLHENRSFSDRRTETYAGRVASYPVVTWFQLTKNEVHRIYVRTAHTEQTDRQTELPTDALHCRQRGKARIPRHRHRHPRKDPR